MVFYRMISEIQMDIGVIVNVSFTLKHARYFVAAAQSGKISQAAIDLNISQSAVTTAILHLESVLGLSLFDRSKAGVTLTESGYRFLRHAQHILSAVEDAGQVAREVLVPASGRVSIGMTYTVAGYFAAPLLDRARRVFPNLSFEFQEKERPALERDLVEGSLDLALLLTSNLTEHSNLERLTLVRSRRRLWLPDGHELCDRPGISLKDLAAFPYIALNVDEAANTQRTYWHMASVDMNVIFETSSVEAVRTMVASGMGITVLSDMVYRPWSLDGRRIVTRDLIEDIPTMDVGLAWSPDRDLTPQAHELRDFIRRFQS